MDLATALRSAVKEVLQYLRGSSVRTDVLGSSYFGDVTRVFDRVAEELIVSSLINRLGRKLLIVSEEMGVKAVGEPEYIAVIDPVDGSTNYEAGIPWSSVSIAIAPYSDKAVIKDVQAAIVAEVFRDRVYEFSEESGVKVNGLRPSRPSKPLEVLLGYFETPEAYTIIPGYWGVRGGRVALRSLGCVSLDIIYVALGRAEGFADLRAKIRNVDVAASIAIAEELGAKSILCNGVPASEVTIKDLVKIDCLLVGFNEYYLGRLVKAFKLRRSLSARSQ